MARICRYHKKKLRKESCQYFNIGLGRTGNRSLAVAVRSLGLTTRWGMGSCPKCVEDAKNKFIHSDCNFDVYRTCDFVTDVAQVHWKRLANVFPESKFVLTIRPMEEWLNSWEKFRKSHKKRVSVALSTPLTWGVLRRISLYGGVDFNRDVWRQSYIDHNKNILDYFENSNRLVSVNVFQMADNVLWEKLGGFFGIDNKSISFPHIKHGQKG